MENTLLKKGIIASWILMASSFLVLFGFVLFGYDYQQNGIAKIVFSLSVISGVFGVSGFIVFIASDWILQVLKVFSSGFNLGWKKGKAEKELAFNRAIDSRIERWMEDGEDEIDQKIRDKIDMIDFEEELTNFMDGYDMSYVIASELEDYDYRSRSEVQDQIEDYDYIDRDEVQEKIDNSIESVLGSLVQDKIDHSLQSFLEDEADKGSVFYESVRKIIEAEKETGKEEELILKTLETGKMTEEELIEKILVAPRVQKQIENVSEEELSSAVKTIKSFGVKVSDNWEIVSPEAVSFLEKYRRRYYGHTDRFSKKYKGADAVTIYTPEELNIIHEGMMERASVSSMGFLKNVEGMGVDEFILTFSNYGINKTQLRYSGRVSGTLRRIGIENVGELIGTGFSQWLRKESVNMAHGIKEIAPDSGFSISYAVQKLGTYDRRVLSWMAKEFLGKGNSSVVDNFGEQSLSYLAQAYDKLVEILGDTPVNYSVIEGGQNE